MRRIIPSLRDIGGRERSEVVSTPRAKWDPGTSAALDRGSARERDEVGQLTSRGRVFGGP